MPNTLAFSNEGGTEVGIHWNYDTAIAGITSDMGMVLYSVNESGAGTGLSYNMVSTLGFDEAKQENASPDEFPPGTLIDMWAVGVGGSVGKVAGSTVWPEIVPDVPEAYEGSDWSYLFGVVALNVSGLAAITGFSMVPNGTHWVFSWDKFLGALRYELQRRPAGVGLFVTMAEILATEAARQDFDFDWSLDEDILELASYDFRVRAMPEE